MTRQRAHGARLLQIPELHGPALGPGHDDLLGAVQGHAFHAALVSLKGQQWLWLADKPHVDLGGRGRRGKVWLSGPVGRLSVMGRPGGTGLAATCEG